MPIVQLPDGKKISYSKTVTGYDIAKDISISLAKKALAIQVNDEYKDLSVEISKDSKVKIITLDDDYALELLRHDSAHVMAMAVQQLYPGTQVTIGPVIENGFYYDFAREEPFTDEDLSKIEKKMMEIIDQDPQTRREVWERKKAIDHFKSIGESYKAELIDAIPGNEEISIYFHGDWHDLCRGPHLPSIGRIGKAFKLMKVAGAYWRGDSNNVMLQRIYGTCWKSKKDLDLYLHNLEEAEKRDHRKLGKTMDLFHFQEESPGAVFWHQKGWTLFQTLVDFMRKKQLEAGYMEVNTPEIIDRGLWEKSGHWEKFQEYMYTTVTPDERTFAIKPMNCPGHCQVYNQGLKSYKDLPLKLSEFGKVHRYEPSGALHGLMRVRSFTQDDAHIFCTEEQITEESVKVTKLILDIYKSFGFENVSLKYADRPEKRVGDDAVWDQAEKALLEAIKASNVDYTLNKGEGAFYGPKIEFVLRDAIGRDWQCGTLQVDLNLPGRLGSTYIDKEGKKKTPVMLHRALFGSLERFTGILIEHYAGKLPFWLSPVQVAILPINEEHHEYAKEMLNQLEKNSIRPIIDLRNEKINYKIREHSLAKVPVLMICGSKEVQDKTITLRRLGKEDQQTAKFSEILSSLSQESQAPKF
ncbi:MAG: threonine--tRNA ligase [Pelagibacteraceae bacterium]|jgi:threonyl-tRNA synthetase|nr:threonine--tRNA ligase [Pseudomonadota bacterium]NCW79663.1 threonine--tRNA ligase [Pelagibacteraceae bacterium]